MNFFKGTFLDVLKRNIERLNKEYYSYCFDEDYHRACFAFMCKSKDTGKEAEFIVWPCPDEDTDKRYKLTILGPSEPLPNLQNPLDLEELYENLEYIVENYEPVKMKLREPYYKPKGTMISLSNDYYW